MERIEQLKNLIAELKTSEQTLRDMLIANSNAQRESRIEIFEIESGLKIGDKVKFKYGNILKNGILNGYDTKYGSVYAVVREFKKDGTLGIRTTSVYQRDISKSA